MATVRITESLLSDVRINVQNIYGPKIAVATDMPQHWSEAIYNFIFDAETQKKMAALPEIFFVKRQHMRFVGFDGQSPENFMLRSSKQFLFPALNFNHSAFYSCDNGKVELKNSDFYITLNHTTETERFFVEEYTPAMKNLSDLRALKIKVAKDIPELLKTYPSLNKALKEVPALRTFISESTLRNVDTKVVRAPKQEKEKPEAPVIDPDVINTIVGASVAIKLGG
jgi:hypothetical protein